MNKRHAFLLLVIATFLAACGAQSEGPTEKPAADAALAEESSGAADAPRTATSDEDCGSLKPLLAVLPAAHVVGTLQETFRGCDRAERAAKVIYATTSDPHSEYVFTVEVIDGASPLVDQSIGEGTAEETKSLRAQLTQTGNIARARLDLCREYHTNPIKADGRNPLIVPQAGLDVCVMDGMDADKEHWFTFSFTPQLRLELELIGTKAGKITSTATAAEHLVPLFAQFNVADSSR